MKLPDGFGSDLERSFDTQVRSLSPDLPKAEPQYRFAADRRWTFDRAWPVYKVAVELEGGAYGHRVICHQCGAVVRGVTKSGTPGRELRAGGGHQQTRFLTDLSKYNVASLLGWTVLRFTHDDVYGDPWPMCETLRRALENRAWRIRQVESLTPNEDRLLHLIAGGARLGDIAMRLGLGEMAAKKQSERLRMKLMATNRAAAVARGFAWGLIEPDRIPWEWEHVELALASGTFLQPALAAWDSD